MNFVTEPQRQVPVIYECDLVVVGGSCTGLFAAVRAARLGLRVALVEVSGRLGGVACNGLVNIWHSLYDICDEKQIISGLTEEMVNLLAAHGDAVVSKSESSAIRFNSEVLCCELDVLAKQNNIRLFLHTYYASLVKNGDRVDAVLVESKDGRGALRASFFIDATGDGDLCRDAGVEAYRRGTLQPPSLCFMLQDKNNLNLNKLMREHGEEFGLEEDWGWGGGIPGIDGIRFRADFHTYGVDCSKADDLTLAEIDGRRKALALTRLLQKYGSEDTRLVSLASAVGIRETAHYKTCFCADEKNLLLGTTYPDTVMRGSYRVDIHHSNDVGITFKYLDGRQISVYGRSGRREEDSWLGDYGLTKAPAAHYEIPFGVLVQNAVSNLIPAGRMINADEGAFGALRVMVNLNQLGEAAGVAAYLALNGGKRVSDLDGREVRKLLIKGGSALE